MTSSPDTIAAIATAPGRGGIGVVRVSGRGLMDFAVSMTGQQLTPRLATYTDFLDQNGDILDKGIALFFVGPYSYTGEDVLELQGHGGPAVLQNILQRCLQLGARLAQPGEFTQRAFLNDKIDLLQAEGVADLIDATSQQAARSAIRSLQGDFSAAINSIVSSLVNLRILVEASLDFPEEEGVDTSDKVDLFAKLAAIQKELWSVEELSKQGQILREGAQVVLVGAPNVGKSSLLNHLAGDEVALVSEIPGTTRDAIRQELQIRGVPLHIIDTAGLRQTDDVVELMGIARTQQNIERADLVLLLSDASASTTTWDEPSVLTRIPHSIPRLFIHNKIDLAGTGAQKVGQGNDTHLFVSAKTGEGIDSLREKILETIGWHNESGVFMARARHFESLSQASVHLSAAVFQMDALELVAEELRQAQLALNRITGEFVADDLLGKIFSQFCIGK